ncbi:alpha/beta hydrolase [Desulfococcaceae bacterium HSG8]|nr:alpha/beta hydrolase [Desulfococcaceae bacterium HSG8]
MLQNRELATRNELVILLHGLGRTSRSMSKLEKQLSRRGFNVMNIGYPSTKYPVEALVRQLDDQIMKSSPETAGKVHFVTHSMGGILVRGYLRKKRIRNLGRVVMLSPPNQGSEIADHLREWFLYQWLNGPAGQQLGTEPTSLPNRLGPVNFELGVITGSKSFNPLFSSWIPGEDDGKVSVASARIEGMRDFIIVPCTHTFIMRNDKVIRQVIYFLNNGCFSNKNGKEVK